MHNCVGEVLLLGIFAVTAYRDWKEQMICVYVPLALLCRELQDWFFT